MINVINLTPHDITVRDLDNPGDVVFPASGHTARLAEYTDSDADSLRMAVGYDPVAGCEVHVGELPVQEVRMGEIEGLPDPRPGTVYLVSGWVAQAAARAGRDDVVAPGSLIRDDAGRPVACEGFRKYAAQRRFSEAEARRLMHLAARGAEHGYGSWPSAPMGELLYQLAQPSQADE